MTRGKPVALVTGASMGLGREYARLLARDGHDLVLVARSEELLRRLARELEDAHGASCRVLVADLADPDAPKRIVQVLADLDVAVDVLVNNAGFGTNGPFLQQDPGRELDMIQVNVAAVVHLTRLLCPAMVERGRGAVLNVASVAAFQAGPGMATYYATKAFVLSFSEAIAHELRGTGVTVTCHCPGAVDTEFGHTSGNQDSVLFAAGAADAVAVAEHGYRAMKAGRVVAVPGAVNWLAAQSARVTPRALLRPITAWVNSKA